MKNTTFRFAKKEDTLLILEFIKELAIYEKMENLVVADKETIANWLFDKGRAEVIFALEDGKEVGFVLFFHNFSTFLGRAGIYIEDLFVKPEFRKRGHGKGLIKEVARICVERNCGRLEFCCLDWNKPSIDFYLSLGATPLNDWTTYRFEGQSLSNLLK